MDASPTHEHARSLQPLHAADFVKQMLVAIAQEKLAAIREQIELVDDGQEIVCGIRTLAVPSHTLGYMIERIVKRHNFYV